MSIRYCRAKCDCAASKEWGYQVWKWTGKKWHGVAATKTVAQAVGKASRIKCVMICCRGCGKELLREYPVVAEAERVKE